jgi:hypothetical protein
MCKGHAWFSSDALSCCDPNRGSVLLDYVCVCLDQTFTLYVMAAEGLCHVMIILAGSVVSLRQMPPQKFGDIFFHSNIRRNVQFLK